MLLWPGFCLHMLIANRVLAMKVVWSREAKCILKKIRPKFRLYKTSYCSRYQLLQQDCLLRWHHSVSLGTSLGAESSPFCKYCQRQKSSFGINLKSFFGHSKRCETNEVSARNVSTASAKQWISDVGWRLSAMLCYIRGRHWWNRCHQWSSRPHL